MGSPFSPCSVFQYQQVMSVKAIGIAIKLTLEGMNQFVYTQTWFFLSVAVFCVITQLNYLNKVTPMSITSITIAIFLIKLNPTMCVSSTSFLDCLWLSASVCSGTRHVQCCTRLPNILRDVHNSDHNRELYNVQGSSNYPPMIRKCACVNCRCKTLLLFQDWSGQNVSSVTSEICGFITVLSGTIILHMTREEEASAATGMVQSSDLLVQRRLVT